MELNKPRRKKRKNTELLLKCVQLVFSPVILFFIQFSIGAAEWVSGFFPLFTLQIDIRDFIDWFHFN